MNCCHSNSNPLLVVLLLTLGCGCHKYSSTLHYDTIRIDGGENVTRVYDGWGGGETPLYFRLPERPDVTYSTKTITEEKVKAIALRVNPQSKWSASYQFDDKSYIEFRDGKYQNLSLGSGCAVSPRPDGEFVLLPSDERTIRKVFGKPTSVEWNQVRPVWH